MNKLGCAAAALMALALAGCYDANRVFKPGDIKHDPFEMFHDVNIEEVIQNPDAFKNQAICFELMYNGYGDENIWLPFYTKFTPEQFIPFSGWSPRARIWQPQAYAAPIRTLFVQRSEPSIDVWNWPNKRRFAIITVKGTVEVTYEKLPWIHVSDISACDEPQFTAESLGAMIRAMDVAAEGGPGAIRHLEDLLAMRLSPTARLDVHLTLGALYMKENDGKSAVQAYTYAQSLAKDDVGTRESIRVSLTEARQLAERQAAVEQLKEPPPAPAPK